MAAAFSVVALSSFTMPAKDRLVNDFAGVLSSEQTALLENRLVAFADTTSNQILVAIYPELENDNEAEMAYRIGEQMGVGQEKYNNGVVMLVKAKMNPSDFRAAFIATGYGLEGALPDALCSRIVRQEMIPYLKQDDYFHAIESGLNAIMPILAGEISTDEFAGSQDDDGAVATAVIFMILFVFFIIVLVKGSRNNGNGKGGGGRKMSALEKMLLLDMLSGRSGRSNRGGFGGFGGGGFGGGSGGGFGGFGGGHFGGGGGGGRC